MYDQPKTTEEELAYQVKLGDALNRLGDNPDFQLVIEQDFISRGLLERSSDILSDNDKIRNSSIDEIKAIHIIVNHLALINNIAESAIEEMES